MKKGIYLLMILAIISCNHNNNKEIVKKEQIKLDTLKVDSVMYFKYNIDIHDTCITNTTDNRRIDLLLNKVDGFLGGKFDVRFKFGEYMWGGDLFELENGLLFCNRLLITKDGIKYFKNHEFNIKNTNHKLIKLHGAMCKDLHKKDIRNPDRFNFEDGIASIYYIKPMCMDANFDKVILNYNNGKIVISNIPDASFFEYDLDNDGIKEQYIIGGATCGPELVILRITKYNNK